MKLLLDTVTFLHAAFSPERISPRATELLLHADHEIYVSIASYWEIAIKISAGKLALPDSPDRFLREHRERIGAHLLPLDEESVLQVTRLPILHRDPFDRILICQAVVHGMVLLSPDKEVLRYPVRTAW